MLLLGDKYLDRRLRRLGHRRCSLAALCLASLPAAMAAASRLESLWTQLLTHNLLGSRRKPTLEPLPSASPVLVHSLFARGQQGWSFHMTHMRARRGEPHDFSSFSWSVQEATSERWPPAFFCAQLKTGRLISDGINFGTKFFFQAQVSAVTVHGFDEFTLLIHIWPWYLLGFPGAKVDMLRSIFSLPFIWKHFTSQTLK